MFSYRPFITETICCIAGKQIHIHAACSNSSEAMNIGHDEYCSMFRWCCRSCLVDARYVVIRRVDIPLLLLLYTMGDERIYARAFNICVVSLCVQVHVSL